MRKMTDNHDLNDTKNINEEQVTEMNDTKNELQTLSLTTFIINDGLEN